VNTDSNIRARGTDMPSTTLEKYLLGRRQSEAVYSAVVVMNEGLDAFSVDQPMSRVLAARRITWKDVTPTVPRMINIRLEGSGTDCGVSKNA
jgi:hypothetical protein